MKNVITMVGTSIFANYHNDQRDDIYEDLKDTSLRFADIEDYEEECQELKREVIEWAKHKEDASAEIKSLLKIKEELKEDRISVQLLATDTILSPLAAEIIKEWFEGKEGFEVRFEKEYGQDVIKGLQVKNSKEFEEEGLITLFERIKRIIDQNTQDVIFNITGGYKAVVPFLTFYAQLYAIPVYYIFEMENELIKLPQLPIQIDLSFIEDHFMAFEAIKPDKEKKSNFPDKEKFLEYLHNEKNQAERIFKELQQNKLITIEDNKVILTIYGRLIHNKFFMEKATEYQTLKGTFMELKVFDYFYHRYSQAKDINIYHSKEFKPYEADIVIENKKNKQLEIIEIKPGNRIPFNDIKDKKIKGLLPAVKKQYPDYQLTFKVYLYHKVEILNHLKEQMRECNQLAKQIMGDNFKVEWYWLKITNKIYQAKELIKDTDIILISVE